MLNFAKDAGFRPVGIQADNSHTLVVGQPSSGKTKLLDSVILEILRSNEGGIEESKSGVIIVDPKQTGFRAWRNERVFGSELRIYQDPKTFSNVFEALVQEHERRTAVFQERGIEDLPSDMNRIYVVVDEFPSLVSDAAIIGGDAVKSIAKNVQILLRLSRQTGIQLYAASQSAEGKNLINAQARGLFANRVLMKCSNASEAEMTLNVDAAELNLDNMLPGECYVKTAHLDLFRAWSNHYPNKELAGEIVRLPSCAIDFSFLDRRGL